MSFKTILLSLSLLQALPAQGTDSPYSLRWSTDGAIFGAAFAVAFTASSIDDSLPILTAEEIRNLQKADINPIDRLTAGWYSNEQSQLSDLLVGGSIHSPLLFLFDPAMRDDVGTISTMYLETVMFATFMPSYGKGGVRRIRPYVYGSPATMAEKQDIEALRSFYSGHATWAFATSIFFASVYTDYHPESEHRSIVWGGAIGLASAVSLLRVTSGAHFLSDILVGAGVGSSIGYLIPYLHRNGDEYVSIRPVVLPDYSGMSMTLRLK